MQVKRKNTSGGAIHFQRRFMHVRLSIPPPYPHLDISFKNSFSPLCHELFTSWKLSIFFLLLYSLDPPPSLTPFTPLRFALHWQVCSQCDARFCCAMLPSHLAGGQQASFMLHYSDSAPPCPPALRLSHALSLLPSRNANLDIPLFYFIYYYFNVRLCRRSLVS